MTAADRRAARLLCLLLVLAGVTGCVLVAVGYIHPETTDASAAFPLSVAGGILGLSLLAPHRRR